MANSTDIIGWVETAVIGGEFCPKHAEFYAKRHNQTLDDDNWTPIFVGNEADHIRHCEFVWCDYDFEAHGAIALCGNCAEYCGGPDYDPEAYTKQYE